MKGDWWKKAKVIGSSAFTLYLVVVAVLVATGNSPQQKLNQRCAEKYGEDNYFTEGAKCHNLTVYERIGENFLYQRNGAIVSARDFSAYADIGLGDAEKALDKVVEGNCHYVKVESGWFKDTYTYNHKCFLGRKV